MYDIHELEVGMSASYSQTISEADIKQFAGVSGDRNPVHLDELYAEKSRFKKRIAHGMISSSFFSALFGTKLPGEGCVYVAQSLKFRKPVYIDDTVTATVVVDKIDLKKRRVFFNTYCKVGRQKVITGEAEIYIPEKDI
ncbi:MaoC family dehydratase [Vibrio breoganii]